MIVRLLPLDALLCFLIIRLRSSESVDAVEMLPTDDAIESRCDGCK